MKQTLKIIAASALATAIVIKVAPALAEPAPLQAVSVVRTADLDLSSKQGRAVLDHRLVTAAYEVCGAASNIDLAGKDQARACRANVLAKARADSRQLADGGSAIAITAAR
jgi:UrcA family protein